MSCSDAGLARVTRSAEFERLAGALDEGRVLIKDGFVDEAWELLRVVLESVAEESALLDWFKHSVAELMSKEVDAAITE